MKAAPALLFAFTLLGAGLVTRGDKKPGTTIPAATRNPYLVIFEENLGVHMIPDTSLGNASIGGMRYFGLKNADHQDACIAYIDFVDLNNNYVLDTADKPASMAIYNIKDSTGHSYAFDPCNFPGLHGDTASAVVITEHNPDSNGWTFALSKDQVGDIKTYIAHKASRARQDYGIK